MLRRIITIDPDKCNGCRLCVDACHEGAIGMVAGKAQLLRDDYCDGLGDCLPACPTGAIRFEEREAAAYDEAAVQALKAERNAAAPPSSCPGLAARAMAPGNPAAETASASQPTTMPSRLGQWPVQIKLAPLQAPFFQGAKLLIAADCAAYAYAAFHEEFMKERVTLIGCPKLDAVDYSEKLSAILAQNEIRSLTIVRMEVPCCGGLENAAMRALQSCGKTIPWQVVTLSIDGRIVDRS